MVWKWKESVWCFALLCAALTAAETLTPKADVYLIFDYVPTAVYAGDQIVVNVRVQNTTATEIKASWLQSEVSRSGEKVAPKEIPIVLKPNATTSAQFIIRTEATQFAIALREGANEIAKLKADVVLDSEPWPKTVLRNGALENEAGERLVFLTQRRDKKIDRAFLPMKWLLSSNEQEKGSANAPRVAQFIPEGYSAQAATALGPFKLDGLPPIVHATRQILDSIKDEKVCVIVLPPEDIEAATDPRVLRIMLEVLLVRLKQIGVQSVAVVPPFKFGANDTLLKHYWKEASEVCAAHQAKFVDPAEFCAEEFWRVDTKTAGIYGARPNADGRARLDSVIKTLLPIQK